LGTQAWPQMNEIDSSKGAKTQRKANRVAPFARQTVCRRHKRQGDIGVELSGRSRTRMTRRKRIFADEIICDAKPGSRKEAPRIIEVVGSDWWAIIRLPGR